MTNPNSSPAQIANSFSSVDSLQFLMTKVRIETKHKSAVHRIFERCQRKSVAAGVVDWEGRGKSTAIAEYYFGNENVFYVKVGESYKNKRFLQELVYTVSGTHPSPSLDMYLLVKQLSWLLTQDSKRKLVIVDDAGKLQPTGLGYFHELIGNTRSCTSFVFVGLQYFKVKMEGWRLKGIPGIGEFYRLIESWYEDLPPLSREEKFHYCKVKGLTSLKAIHEACKDSEAIWQLEHNVDKLLEIGESNVFEEPVKATPLKSKFRND